MCLRLRGALAACAVVAALPVLAACSSDDGAGPSPLPTSTSTTPAPSSTSPSGSSSASPKAPVKPANANDYSAAGMKSFAAYAISTINYAYSHGDSRPLEQVDTGTCKPCKSLVADTQRIWGRGGRTEGSQMKVKRLDTIGPSSGVLPSVTADVSLSAYRSVNSAGNVLRQQKALPSVQFIFDLKRKGDKWFLSDVRRGAF